MEDFFNLTYKYYKFPLTNMYYSVTWIWVNYYWLEVILRLPCHYAQALVYDTLLLVTGKKPQMIRLYKKIHKFADAISYFATKEINITNDNVKRLWNEQNDVDKQIYPFNMADFDWEDYLKHLALGIKKYLMKDKMDDESIQKAINQERKFQLLHRILQAVLLIGGLYILWMVFNKI